MRWKIRNGPKWVDPRAVDWSRPLVFDSGVGERDGSCLWHSHSLFVRCCNGLLLTDYLLRAEEFKRGEEVPF